MGFILFCGHFDPGVFAVNHLPGFCLFNSFSFRNFIITSFGEPKSKLFLFKINLNCEKYFYICMEIE
jgi:hypothetical protein